jgi:hypothetical protein
MEAYIHRATPILCPQQTSPTATCNPISQNLTPQKQQHAPPVLAQVDALVLLEVISQEIHNALVKVITTQVCVTAGAQHLKHTVANLQDRHIKGAATQVEHQDGLVALALKAIGQGGSCGLVDDTQDIQASNLA